MPEHLKKRAVTIFLLLFVILSNLYFGYPRLKTFSGIDEPLWSYGRVPNFWEAVSESRWKATSLCDKPGITLALVSGLGLPFIKEDPETLQDLRYEPKSTDELQKINDLYFYLRLPVYIFALLIIPLFYFFTKRLLGRRTAQISTIFIGLSPVLLGISMMINTDAILWGVLPLTLLAFLIYQKENNRKFLYLSGFLLGLALIDKYIANILFPFFFGLILLKPILDDETCRNKNYFKKAFLDFGLLILVSLATIFLFYPAAWVKPGTILDVTIFSKAFYRTWQFFFAIVALGAIDTYFFKNVILGKFCEFFNPRKLWVLRGVFLITLALISFVFINVYFGMKFFDFQPVFNSPSPQLSAINRQLGEPAAIMLSSFYSLVFGLTPIAMFFFVYATTVFGFSKREKNLSSSVFVFLLFILFYYLGSAASGVSPTVRYQIVLYPLASIIAAAGINHLVGLKKFPTLNFKILLTVIFAFSLFSLKSSQPFFLAYASDLLPKKYVLNFRDMGDGSWQAAQYLNSLPDAKNISVWSDKGGVCEAFVGKCSDSLKPGKLNTDFDYFVITAGRKAKSLKAGKTKKAELNGLKIADIYDESLPTRFRLDIDDRSGNYVKVIKAEDLTR